MSVASRETPGSQICLPILKDAPPYSLLSIPACQAGIGATPCLVSLEKVMQATD